MELNSIEIFNGIFSGIYVIFSILVGIRLILKYFKEKNRVYIYVGLTWIGFSTLWFAASISFLSFIIIGKSLVPILYFLIGVSLIPFFLLVWITVFSILVYENKKLILQIIFGIYGIFFEIIFLFFLFTDISFIGVQNTPIDTDWGLFMTIYFIITIFIGFISGIIFAYRSMKSENPEIRLRGKFLFIAVLFWALGSVIDTIMELPLMRTLAIVLLIIASILWYFTFNLPKFLKK